jgi:hypothetical protein
MNSLISETSSGVFYETPRIHCRFNKSQIPAHILNQLSPSNIPFLHPYSHSAEGQGQALHHARVRNAAFKN